MNSATINLSIPSYENYANQVALLESKIAPQFGKDLNNRDSLSGDQSSLITWIAITALSLLAILSLGTYTLFGGFAYLVATATSREITIFGTLALTYLGCMLGFASRVGIEKIVKLVKFGYLENFSSPHDYTRYNFTYKIREAHGFEKKAQLIAKNNIPIQDVVTLKLLGEATPHEYASFVVLYNMRKKAFSLHNGIGEHGFTRTNYTGVSSVKQLDDYYARILSPAKL